MFPIQSEEIIIIVVVYVTDMHVNIRLDKIRLYFINPT